MIHLPGLPGSPRPTPLAQVLEAARRDASRLVEAGFPGLVIENYGDAPFLPGAVKPITIAAMARVIGVLKEEIGEVPLGVNVLRNDACGALGLAAAFGLQSIRVNVHAGARVTDQGLLEGRAWETLRLRAAWGADDVAIWADVRVKHSAPLGTRRPVAEEVAEAVERGLADAVIVTGAGTGVAVDDHELLAVCEAAAGAPVLVGSGVNEATVAPILSRAHGAIVGTATKEGGVTTAPVDLQRARVLIQAAGL
jgi:uncharacterized protein